MPKPYRAYVLSVSVGVASANVVSMAAVGAAPLTLLDVEPSDGVGAPLGPWDPGHALETQRALEWEKLNQRLNADLQTAMANPESDGAIMLMEPEVVTSGFRQEQWSEALADSKRINWEGKFNPDHIIELDCFSRPWGNALGVLRDDSAPSLEAAETSSAAVAIPQ